MTERGYRPNQEVSKYNDLGNQINEGGEGKIYKINSTTALKRFIRPDDPELVREPKKQADAVEKLEEMQSKLHRLKNLTLPPRVIAPKEIEMDRGEVIGYTMRYLENENKLSDYTNGEFRKKNNLSNNDVVSIFRDLHATVTKLHEQDICIGDFNDLNILVNRREKAAYLIDVDSFQIGDEVSTKGQIKFRDPKRKEHERATKDTDWYAFNALLFQSLLMVGPYAGTHDKYDEYTVRARKRISIYDRKVKVSERTIPTNALPQDLDKHFKRVFESGKRGAFPIELLDMQWTKCGECGADHARSSCPKTHAPKSQPQSPAQKETLQRQSVLEKQANEERELRQGLLALARKGIDSDEMEGDHKNAGIIASLIGDRRRAQTKMKILEDTRYFSSAGKIAALLGDKSTARKLLIKSSGINPGTEGDIASLTGNAQIARRGIVEYERKGLGHQAGVIAALIGDRQKARAIMSHLKQGNFHGDAEIISILLEESNARTAMEVANRMEAKGWHDKAGLIAGWYLWKNKDNQIEPRERQKRRSLKEMLPRRSSQGEGFIKRHKKGIAVAAIAGALIYGGISALSNNGDEKKSDQSIEQIIDRDPTSDEARASVSAKEKQAIEKFFGHWVDVPTPSKELMETWKKAKDKGFTMEAHYLPATPLYQNDNFPGWTNKPESRFWESMTTGASDMYFALPQDAATLTGNWILIDSIKGLEDAGQDGDWANHTLRYKNDPLGNVMKNLRKNGTIGDNAYSDSRFIASWNDVHDHVLPTLAGELDLKPSMVRLPRAIESNFIQNAFSPDMEDASYGHSNWLEDIDTAHPKYHLYSTHDSSADSYHKANYKTGGIGFRPMIVFPS